MAKKTKKTGRKRCSIRGCRKMRVEGSLACRDHQGALRGESEESGGNGDPTTEIKKLSEVDLLRFLNSDNELHNHKLEIKNLDQEQRLEHLEFEQRKATRTARVRQLSQSIRIRENEQKLLLQELAKKYGFDPSTASIDDKTGIIHEHA